MVRFPSHPEIRIENLHESNIDDLIHVCSWKRLDDPVHQQGMKLKREWLNDMLDEYGSCAKIAYYKEKPVAQTLFFPEEADTTKSSRRKNVLVIICVYNPTKEAQKLGIGTMLLKNVIEDVKQRRSCLGNNPCKFILAKAFDTGEFLSLTEFYEKNDFMSAPCSEENCLYLQVEGQYEPAEPIGEYEALPEDKNKAIVFYSPICQFSYQFASIVERMIREVAPNIKIEMINEWKDPEESIKRRNQGLIVNAKPIQTFFMETEKFKEEVRQAAF